MQTHDDIVELRQAPRPHSLSPLTVFANLFMQTHDDIVELRQAPRPHSLNPLTVFANLFMQTHDDKLGQARPHSVNPQPQRLLRALAGKEQDDVVHHYQDDVSSRQGDAPAPVSLLDEHVSSRERDGDEHGHSRDESDAGERVPDQEIELNQNKTDEHVIDNENEQHESNQAAEHEVMSKNKHVVMTENEHEVMSKNEHDNVSKNERVDMTENEHEEMGENDEPHDDGELAVLSAALVVLEKQE
jgi:hypothetical protein